ncbi:CotH kinase family protein [Treponema sp. R6D11]
MKKTLFNQIICLFLIALCCFFASCPETNVPADNTDDSGGGYNNPNAGGVKELHFSHNSGLYNQQFSLVISAAQGSSIYYTTDGSVPAPNKAGTNRYSAPITVQNRNGQANVLAANAAKFYMDPSDPRGSVPQVYTPNDAQVPKATVIRAIAVSSSGEVSGVATKTYFIGNNLADYGNIRVVSLVSDPYNLVDENYGIMVRGKSSNRWDGTNIYNFRQKGEDWERPAYLEIFEGNSRNIAALSTGVGIRVRGGWSRGIGQKSFSVYFKEQYGIKNLKNYNLIPKDTTLGTTGAVKADGKTPVDQYKGFMLRNGANDCEYTKFYDVFLQDLLSDRSFSTQASVPCIVYLNGEYWGPYNFQERHSDNQTEYKYGVDKDNVISYDNGELDDGNPGEEPDFEQMITMATNNYSAFCDIFDIDNFVDYWAAEIYIYNEDWPHNNYRMWRTRTVDSGNLKYGDTKWRYQMFDVEFALGIYNNGELTGQSGRNAIAEILDGDDRNHQNNRLFKALLANPDFCKKFVNTMLDLYNVNFHPDNYLPKLNNYAMVYRPLMTGYFSRWGGWDGMFNNKVNDAKNYLSNIRSAMVSNYLPNYFGTGSSGIANIGVTSGNLRDVTLSVAGVSGASIKINSVTPKLTSGSWTGKYCSTIPITVTASAPPNGYEFNGWTITGGTPTTSLDLTITVNITGNAQITAKYKQIGISVVPVTGVNLNQSSLNLKIGDTSTLTATVTPSNATYNTVIWTSNDSSVASVNNGTVTAVSPGTTVIKASTVEGMSATCTVTVRPPTVLLDLAARLQELSTQTIDTWDKFYTAFNDLPVNPGDEIPSKVTYEIINDSGVNKLKVNVFINWGAGFIVNDGITFQAGDIIEFKGKKINGPSPELYVNTNCWDWAPLQNWNIPLSDGEAFDKTFTLSAGDASTINANAEVCDGDALAFKSNGIAPYDGSIVSVGSFVIEQIKISRIE